MKLEIGHFGRNQTLCGWIFPSGKMLLCDINRGWGVGGSQGTERHIWSQSTFLEPNTVHPLLLERLAPHYLPILAPIWGENAALHYHFRGTLITRATHLHRSRLLPPSSRPHPRLPLSLAEDRQRWGIFCVFCSEKGKFELERWSEASKGTCNWAALDRISGNMKQQQLWRRVIASPGSYNALSSL